MTSARAAVSTDECVRTVAGLLGHAKLKTTLGYAHPAEALLTAAAGQVFHQLAKAPLDELG